MEILKYVMIFLGSALMVVNILRYFRFTRRIGRLRVVRNKMLLFVPLMLLIFFLLGYIAVGVFGSPDLIVAGILFGGSVFVFLLMAIIYLIVDRVIENDAALTARYSDLKSSLEALTHDSLAAFTVDLTKDVIEERAGLDLYESDRTAKSYSELLAARRPFLIAKPYETDSALFTCGGLISCFRDGKVNVSEIVLARRSSGSAGFVKLDATLAEQPGTGDVIAFITERPCDVEVVDRLVLSFILSDQYDMIAYIEGGEYTVLSRDEIMRRPGSLRAEARSGHYGEYIEGFVAPRLAVDGEPAPEEARKLLPETAAAELAEHGSYELSVECIENGKSYYKQFIFFPVNRDADYYLLFIKDTTELHRERTEQNEKLRQALEAARRANKSKTMFFSNISHDIRTPMNAIIGFAEAARRTEEPERVREYLEKINVSGEYLLSLINDVLELSRIESGKLELLNAPADLNKSMREVSDIFGEQMRKKGVDYSVETEGVEHPFVLCDRVRFDRVLLNLVSNAYKFTPEGGSVRVTLTETSAADGRASFTVRVKDTGVGMTTEFAAKIFEAFSRDRSADAGNVQGTGLGMSITKNIVDLMGGRIAIDTAPGKGTEFIIDLSFPIVSESEIPGRHAADDEVAIVPSEHRILIVDDNQINREIAKLVLEDKGFSTEEAENGREAVEAVKSAPAGYFSMILMDVQMPVMTGPEAAKEIRSLPDPRADIPIVAATANVFDEDIRVIKASGMNGYIAKPFTPDEMSRKIVLAITGGKPDPRPLD